MCFSMEGLLAGFANSSDGQSVLYALKVMEVYLHSFKQLVGDISGKTSLVVKILFCMF